MQELTRTVLEDVARWKHQGVIPATRPCCGQDYCICPDAQQLASLRDYARDQTAYDNALNQAQPTRLHVVTTGPPNQPSCNGSMTCSCQACSTERASISAKGAGPAAFRVRRRAA
jgi:hypothetical protein